LELTPAAACTLLKYKGGGNGAAILQMARLSGFMHNFSLVSCDRLLLRLYWEQAEHYQRIFVSREKNALVPSSL